MNYRTKCKIRRALAIGMLGLVAVMLMLMPVFGRAMAETADVLGVEVPVPIIDEEVSWLNVYMNEAIIAVCLAIGLLYKHCTPFENRYIPLIVAVVGIAAAIAIHWTEGITMLVIVEGIWSGLASTGLHQLFSKLFMKTE